ncbi:outer membrane protein assembly factor BamB family protein [Bowmanella dokdonensis]|uniref:PQQ-binding-like beta-propeller repeat protein n=1 Tax=Bowmanella dokdonensis TaxID=751969 RepID=A0A939DKH9_9ALTE|nr:PQQ-binding-like beta-propeller repeat protein [Bowmanella dokdonensis]MBN7823840.1 PQQ-binding-like beta-propeller repeat protein [Bowmanella dokdonensis]
MRSLCWLFCLLFPLAVEAELLWEYQSGGPVTAPPLITNKGLFLAAGQAVHHLDKRGALLNRLPLDEDVRSTPVIHQGLLLVHGKGGLFAFSADGSQLWHHASQDGPLMVAGETWGWGEGVYADPWAWYRSGVAVKDNTAFYSDSGGTYAVELKTGKRLWHRDTGQTHTTPVVGDDAVFAASWNNSLYALSPANGEILWRFDADLPAGQFSGWAGWQGLNLTPTLNGKAIYLGSRGTYLYKLAASSGKEIWRVKHASTWIGSPAMVFDNTLYYGLSDGTALVGQALDSGNLTHLVQSPHLIFAPPVQVDGRIYFATLSGELFEYMPGTGQRRRLYQTRASADHYPRHVKAGGGPNYLPADPQLSPHQATVKQVQVMLREMDSILSLTTDGQQLYLGTATGRLLAIRI